MEEIIRGNAEKLEEPQRRNERVKKKIDEIRQELDMLLTEK
ncbi:hypothetical protein [Candidatus Nardonella dryophthoridicola]|nr:hypothetical protein [Candidatus Nardonella dryophthoridicola]